MLAGNALSSGKKGSAFNWKAFGILTGVEMLGNALAKPEFIGTRLDDLSIQKSTEGVAIPEGYGQFAVAGNIVWSTGKTEHIEDVDTGGKLGPPPAQTATYTSNFATLLSMAPLGNRIERPLKIWFNQHLKYDYNGGDEKGMEFTYDAGEHCWSASKGSASYRIYDGGQTSPDALIEADKGVGTTPAFVDRCVMVIENLPLAEYGNDPPNVRVLFQSEIKSATGMFESICEAASLDISDDTDSGFLDDIGEDIPFLGLLRPNVTAAKDYLDQLGVLLFCQFPVIDGKVTAVKKTGDALFTIDESDCRWSYAGQNFQVVTNRVPERELVERVEINYLDPRRRYNNAMRRGKRIETPSRRKAAFGLSVIMDGAYAQVVADSQTWQEVIESRDWSLSLPWDYIWLTPCDIFNLRRAVTGGQTVTQKVRVQEINKGLPGPVACHVVSQSDKIYELEIGEDISGYSPDIADEIAPTIPFISDTIVLSQSSPDETVQPYVVGGVTARTGYKWTGVHMDLDHKPVGGDSTTWDAISDSTISSPAVMGYLHGNYTPVAGGTYDETATVNVAMYRGSLHSATSTDLLGHGANSILFENGVVISFLNATSAGLEGNGDVRYTLDTIKSGRWGSDDLISGTIASGSRFLLLRDEEAKLCPGYLFLKCSAYHIGRNVRVGTISFGDDDSALNQRPLTNPYRARNMEPLSPMLEIALRDGGTGDLQLKGSARSRYIDQNNINDAALHRPSEPQFGGQFKYRVTLSNGTDSFGLDKYTSDENARFDWTITNAQITTLFGGAVPIGDITGNVAIYGTYGPGRTTSFSE